ncbi:hypothetical protein [Corticicoccus populi]|uniref:Uncharacterized protein n=1 Tax=Corticicoccus populi TaxID=1812821 RepID=A0ABW5X0U0_9STAP
MIRANCDEEKEMPVVTGASLKVISRSVCHTGLNEMRVTYA